MFKKLINSLTGGLGELPSQIIGLLENKQNIKLQESEREAMMEQIKMQIEAQTAQHVNDMEAAHLADVDNARKMQIEALKQDDKFSKRFVYYLASFLILSATVFGIILAFVEIPTINENLFEMFAHVYLFAGAVTVVNFFFGSSKSSHDKNELLKK